MKNNTDLEYFEGGLFTNFLPCSKQGEIAWNELAAQNNGTGKVFSVHAESTIQQLRRAGYIVKKAKPAKLELSEIDAILEAP